jgi:gamma-glutamylcyclotransferase (GGCT)/AIG2-like uncharacterized protein YtfP
MNLPSKINLMVYGTLRSGQYNDRGLTTMVEDSAIIEVSGAMFNLHGDHPVYPVVDFRMEGTVVGEVLVDMPTGSPRFKSICAMEYGAGYVLANIGMHDIPITFPRAEDIYAFHYPIGEYEYVGVPIPDGDWVKFSNRDDREYAW